MSVSSNFSSIISSYDSSIQEKKEENAELEQQEREQREASNEQGWKAFYLKMSLRAQKSKMEYFLKKSGGIFNLNDEQQRQYSQMMTTCSSLSGNISEARDLQYFHTMKAVGFSNRQRSNYLTIFNDTLDRGQYLNQQALFERVQEA